MSTQPENIFEKACLIQLTTSVWSASKSVDPVLFEHAGQNSDWIKGRKFLINPELLGQIKTAAHQARNKVRKYALPFPIHSVQLVPKEYVSTIEDILVHQEERFWDRVSEFEGMYAQAREEAKEVLGNLFNETDYPVDIRRKFKFGWQFLALQVPTQASILSPEIYEKERIKFENLMQETQDLCMQALRSEFAGLLHELTEKLGSNGDRPKKIVSNSMFNKLNEFFCELQTKNIFEDEELTQLAEQAKQAITHVSPASLKYNEQARQQIKNEMQQLQEAVNQSIIDLPRRQIRFDQEVVA